VPDRLARDFPLFPLGIVALPGELVPLHIFEERYKTMMNECLRDEKEFGIVWLSDDGLRETGCACEIERVLERMEDGQMNILTRGTRPFRVVERQSELAYPAGVIEFLEDRDEPVEPELADDARGAYAELVRRATDNEPEAEALAEMGAYAMARDGRLRPGRQAGPARPALRERAAAAPHAAVPGRNQAPGPDRPRSGTRAVKWQGAVRRGVSAPEPPAQAL